MERDEAIKKLTLLNGRELHELANIYDVTIAADNGKINKGWAGHVFERYLGLPLNSAQSPNFGSWELKSIPLIRTPSKGLLRFKETMAITMIDPYHVQRTPFKQSHLLSKLKKFVLVARIVGQNYTAPSYVHSVVKVDLTDELFKDVENDYEEIRMCIKDPNKGFDALSGKMGKYIQPRTKGTGHGSKTRAFYARKCFLAHFINLRNEDSNR